MPTIVMASPKGGAGKSTCAVILGTEMAHMGLEVTMLDCDPTKALTRWSEKGELPRGIKVISGVAEADIIKTIQANEGDGKIVIVDLEGAASRLASRAISRADLVLVPMKPTTLDVEIGSDAIAMVEEEAETLQRPIPYAVVFTATKAVKSKAYRGLRQSILESGVELIEPELLERGAFSAFFTFGGDLRSMPEQGSHAEAIKNAEGFTRAVLSQLIEGQGDE